jgi:predicted metal-dependent phosphoesterase TrpH
MSENLNKNAVKESSSAVETVVMPNEVVAGGSKEQIIKLLQLFIAYGMIHTVEGVSYPDGTHKEAIEEAEKLLWELRKPA